ncbi:hypothetical protein A6U86_28125 [Rhizobium sp. AC27/96]|nr:hypothetical protein A6U86_28125 [Rhizobium sp. AC27/96]
MAKKDASIATLDTFRFEFRYLRLVGILRRDRGFGRPTPSALAARHIRSLPKTMRNQSFGSRDIATIAELKTQ